MRKLIATSTSLFCFAFAAQVDASGFATARFGGEHGNPITDNPTALYYNPSGLSARDGIQVMVDGNLAYRLASFEPTFDGGNAERADPADAPGANYSEGTLTNFIAAPMIGASAKFPLGDSVGLAVGAGFFVPLGGQAVWGENEDFKDDPNYAGAVDGSQRWYSIDGTIRSMYISGGAAISIADIVHVGFSGGVSLNTINTIRARNAQGADNDVSLEGRAWLDVSKTTAQFGAGVMVTPLEDKLRVGFSYQAPPGFYGGMKLEGTLAKQLAGTISGETDPVELHQTLPDIFRLGVSYKVTPELQMRLFGDITRWSLFEDQCIGPAGERCEINEDGTPVPPTTDNNPIVTLPRRWQDAFGIRLGASYWFTPEVEAMLGVGYDSNAVPANYLDPALMDFHDISAALGARIQIVPQLAAQIAYTHFFYISRDTNGMSKNQIMEGTTASPDSGGKYSQTIGVFNLGLYGTFDVFGDDEPEAAPVDTQPGPPQPAAPGADTAKLHNN